MPKSRSSLAAWNSSGPNTIFCASRRASTSDIESIVLPSNDKGRDCGLSMAHYSANFRVSQDA